MLGTLGRTVSQSWQSTRPPYSLPGQRMRQFLSIASGSQGGCALLASSNGARHTLPVDDHLSGLRSAPGFGMPNAFRRERSERAMESRFIWPGWNLSGLLTERRRRTRFAPALADPKRTAWHPSTEA